MRPVRVGLRAGHLVTVTTVGPFLPLLPEPFQWVGLSALVLLSELSRGSISIEASIAEACRRTHADPCDLERFASALRTSGLLIDGSAVAKLAVPRAAAQAQSARSRLLLSDPVTIAQATTLVVHDGRFLWFDHAGVVRESLLAEEVDVLRSFLPARHCNEAYGEYLQRTGGRGLDRDRFNQLVERLFAGRLLNPPRPLRSTRNDPAPIVNEPDAASIRARFVATMAARESGTASAKERIPVIPVNTVSGVRPLALGLLLAHASEFERGRLRDRYDFVPVFLSDGAMLAEHMRMPGIFLFSNYVWNLEENLALSALVKRINPDNITIHGGPSTPKYEGDAEQFFAMHPDVDVAVRGEGEATFVVLLDALGPSRDFRALADVEGLTFRGSGGLVRTPDRERIVDLDTIPSPYMLGMFDPFGEGIGGAVIETNRGCPFGCTFCDWGSAILSKIRLFSLERVFSELEWSASHHIDVCAIADANFGTFERDVVIAEKIADLKRRYGYPRTVGTNYAKNNVRFLRKIVEVLGQAEILTEGLVALQSTDPHTLKVIRRSNIKVESYDALAAEFRRTGLPLVAEIMMGLPGSTPESFRHDLQTCIDRDVKARVHATQVLPNSPMNDPAYRREHGITAGPGEWLVETATYTRGQWDEMDRLRKAYDLSDTWGMLRYVAMFVRMETGLREVDFYDRLQADLSRAGEQWPILWSSMQAMDRLMAPPGSWVLFLADVKRYLTAELNVADDDALETVMRVQLAHLPAPERSFPETVELPHDFAAWQKAVHEAREDGHRDDWETVVPSLRTYPPADLTVDDPYDISVLDVGRPMGYLAIALQSWELDSPVARPYMRYLTQYRPSVDEADGAKSQDLNP